MTLSFTVQDKPGPQGSKRPYGNGRVESSESVRTWRDAVRLAAIAARTTLCDGETSATPFPHGVPVGLQIIFWHRRPKAHYRGGQHATELKPTAPTYVTSKPDVSKLVRSTEDAITAAGVWHDDAQIVRLSIWQRYSDVSFEGAEIAIWEVKP